MAESYQYRVVYAWSDGLSSATVPFDNIDYARKLRAAAIASGNVDRCYIERRFLGEWGITDQSTALASPSLNVPKEDA